MLSHSHAFLSGPRREPGTGNREPAQRHAARRPVVDDGRDQQQDRPPRMHPAVEDVARDEQQHVLRARSGRRQYSVTRDEKERRRSRGCGRSLKEAGVPFREPLGVANASVGGQVIAVGIDRQRLVGVAPVVVEVRIAGLEIRLQLVDIFPQRVDCGGGPSAARPALHANEREPDLVRSASRMISGNSEPRRSPRNRATPPSRPPGRPLRTGATDRARRARC